MTAQATRRVRCSAAVFRRPHLPHNWTPQPGMEPVHCPGAVDELEQTRDLLRAEKQRADKAIERETALEEGLNTRRVLTSAEHDRAWHAIEGAAGEEGADPGTVLAAVLAALNIDAPDEMAESLRRDGFGDDEIADILSRRP